MSTQTLVFPFLLAAATVSVVAQTPVGRPAFEVASVKPNSSGLVLGVPAPRGTFRAQNVSLEMLIERAYDVLPSAISGGPGWKQAERFDINAKFDGDASLDDQKLMLQ